MRSADVNDLTTPPPPGTTNADALVIVSGGQTGVDRAALDAALALGRPCGGWCPARRRAEDGPIPRRYPLEELAGAGYLERTRRNVEDSDATLIVTFGATTGGTARTIEFCWTLKKPHLIVDAAEVPAIDAARQALEFLQTNHVRRLNVAGPRASGEARGYAYTRELVTRLLESC